MKEIKIGIELEGIYNNDLLKQSMTSVGGYGFSKGSTINSFWKHTTDGSLTHEREYPNPICAEIVQYPVVGRSRFITSLKSFQELALGNELKDFVTFNKSCGCHIHFSIPEQLYKNLLVENVEFLRESLFKKLKNSDLPSRVVNGIIKHYGRDYAKMIKKTDQQNIFKGNLDRRTELNVMSEIDNKGLEWRSFNLLGVETWKEFFDVLNIGYDCIEEFIESLRKIRVEENLVVDVPKIPKPKTVVYTIPCLKRFKKCAI
jgi:hypothetical protein